LQDLGVDTISLEYISETNRMGESGFDYTRMDFSVILGKDRLTIYIAIDVTYLTHSWLI
jgi:hypothetical protein